MEVDCGVWTLAFRIQNLRTKKCLLREVLQEALKWRNLHVKGTCAFDCLRYRCAVQLLKCNWSKVQFPQRKPNNQISDARYYLAQITRKPPQDLFLPESHCGRVDQCMSPLLYSITAVSSNSSPIVQWTRGNTCYMKKVLYLHFSFKRSYLGNKTRW